MSTSTRVCRVAVLSSLLCIATVYVLYLFVFLSTPSEQLALLTLPQTSGVNLVAFSPDGFTRDIEIWDLQIYSA